MTNADFTTPDAGSFATCPSLPSNPSVDKVGCSERPNALATSSAGDSTLTAFSDFAAATISTSDRVVVALAELMLTDGMGTRSVETVKPTTGYRGTVTRTWAVVGPSALGGWHGR